jgi:hypothetical protein
MFFAVGLQAQTIRLSEIVIEKDANGNVESYSLDMRIDTLDGLLYSIVLPSSDSTLNQKQRINKALGLLKIQFREWVKNQKDFERRYNRRKVIRLDTTIVIDKP